MPGARDPLRARATLGGLPQPYAYYRLAALADHGVPSLDHLPFTVRILLENLLRHASDEADAPVGPKDVLTLANWHPGAFADSEIAFMPARVLLQDFTGVPC
ncbi:MAG TPA: aconitate hydratase, partial [Ktedonobacterales bacterium]|nr:aconitate hydratase [Ktedonobacterales bacterium]